MSLDGSTFFKEILGINRQKNYRDQQQQNQ